ncbi:Lysosome membrane protein 2 [Clonorchis sinensis]|uniref:Lysosome membrane protein 2 n=1 Tax=Clonorchis sinensis TaxID=79923 RepID=A0A8T1MZB2_CLOSI|nr:Lysosome membrane protein 2 [Clonorchis sinensis]
MNLSKFVIILGVLAIFLFGFLITLVILDPIIWLAVYEKTELKSGTPSFQQWMDPTIDIFFEAYFFNLTNPDEFLSGKKPIVQQVGPYTYRERRFKTEVKRSLYPTMFTYKEVKQYFFDLDRSAGPETDPITTVSMGYLGVDVKFGWLPELVTKVVEFLENRTGEHLIITRSVHELMWGYEDPFLALLKKAFIPVPNTMVGLYLDKNNTDDGIITIYGDNKDKQNYGHIYKYHGSTHLSCWKSDQANQINGSDGSLFHPFMSPTEDPYIFSADICRSLQLHAVGMTRLRGVPVMRYLPYTDTFTSPLKEEKNRGFCINWPDCMADNMFDVSTCIPGAPIAMSLPHFQNGDPSYRDSVIGLHATEELNTTFYIEPITGVVFFAAKKLQINAVVKQNYRFSELARVKSVYLPIMFMNESFSVDDGTAGSILSSIYVGPVVTKTILSIVVVVLAVVVISMAVYHCVRRRHMRPNSAAYTPIEDAHIAEGTTTDNDDKNESDTQPPPTVA